MAARNVKYCGNCNPDVHPKKVKEALSSITLDEGPDVKIAVNGCPRSCLSKSKAVRESKEKIIIMSSRDVIRRKDEDMG